MWGQVVYGKSLYLLFQFCCKSKTALKIILKNNYAKKMISVIRIVLMLQEWGKSTKP